MREANEIGSGSGACARQGRGVRRRSAPFRSCSSPGFGLLEARRKQEGGPALRAFMFINSRATDETDSSSYGLRIESQERPQGHCRTQSVFLFSCLSNQFLFFFLVMVPQLLGLGGRTRATTAASASGASAASSISASYSAPSRSTSAAGPCVAARGDTAAPAAVGKQSRSINWPAIASAAGRDDPGLGAMGDTAAYTPLIFDMFMYAAISYSSSLL